MWWLLFAVGVGVVGCSRNRDEGTPPPVVVSPPPPVVTPRGPLVPPDFASTYNPPHPPIVSMLPIPPVARSPTAYDSCAAFSQAIRANTAIIHPRAELNQLVAITSLIRSRYGSEIARGDFSGVRSDPAIINATNLLEGIHIYLRDGTPGVIDTEADVENLDAARAWILDLSRISAADPDQDNREISRLWRTNNLSLLPGGYMFSTNQVPHNFVRADSVLPAPQFRLVFKTNKATFPQMSPSGACSNIPVIQSSSVQRTR